MLIMRGTEWLGGRWKGLLRRTVGGIEKQKGERDELGKIGEIIPVNKRERERKMYHHSP